MPPSPDTSAAKAALRAELRARRREAVGDLGAAGREREGAALAAHAGALARSLGIAPGETVAAYEARPLEPPTAPLCAALHDLGLRVLVPVTLETWELEWVDIADPERRLLGTAGVVGARLVLVPALAVDPAGTRLGQGGGCYDRTLPRLDGATRVVAVLHPGELSGHPLPSGPLDVPVDAVLTADGLTWTPDPPT